MRGITPALLLLALSAAGNSAVHSEAWSCRSDTRQAALFELYTSQGCSSCPPADRWLSAIKARDDLWTGLVPVAWHVTYWDYLGWRDPFGSAAMSRHGARWSAILDAAPGPGSEAVALWVLDREGKLLQATGTWIH